MTLVEEIYGISNRFPAREKFGLTAQLRRAAISIPSNIGEGWRRKRRKTYLHHLDVAIGSRGEIPRPASRHPRPTPPRFRCRLPDRSSKGDCPRRTFMNSRFSRVAGAIVILLVGIVVGM